MQFVAMKVKYNVNKKKKVIRNIFGDVIENN